MHQRLHAYEKHKENQENRGNGEGGKEWETHIHYPVEKKDCSYASSSHEGKRFLQMKIPEKNSLPFITETDTCDTEE